MRDLELNGDLLRLRALAYPDMDFLDAQFLPDPSGDLVECGRGQILHDHPVQALANRTADVTRLISGEVDPFYRVAAVDVIRRFHIAETVMSGENWNRQERGEK